MVKLKWQTDGRNIEALIILSDYILRFSTYFKNSTKSFKKVLCVNFLELFFSTIKKHAIVIVFKCRSFMKKA